MRLYKEILTSALGGFSLLQSELAGLRAEILATKAVVLSESPELQAKFDQSLVNAKRTDQKIQELLGVASHFKDLLESLARTSDNGGDGSPV